MEELHKRKRKYVEFSLSDSRMASKLLKNNNPSADYELEEEILRIYDDTKNPGEINRLFVENGIMVNRINESEENLEAYFSELIGGGGIA